LTIQLIDNPQYKQANARPVPFAIMDKVEKEVKRLTQEGHLERATNLDENTFISPAVITIKKDGSIKIAMDARELNKNIVKRKHQMPCADALIAQLSQGFAKKHGEIWYSKLDLKYAYGQVKLSKSASKQCVIAISCGGTTGLYRWKRGFYGLADLPAAFQSLMDRILAEFPSAMPFLDDILVATKGTKEAHSSPSPRKTYFNENAARKSRY